LLIRRLQTAQTITVAREVDSSKLIQSFIFLVNQSQETLATASRHDFKILPTFCAFDRAFDVRQAEK
jgi:hypothetical protein